MAVHYVGDNGPDGVCVGTSATELVGFYGATPIVKPTSSTFANIGTSVAVLSSTLASSTGFDTSSIAATTMINTLNAVIEALGDLGLIADA